ncbi:MAG: SOS response-associated peptidase [Hyphomicrobiales bacterium]|nr:SOS response-associated peptidase [Hyphomicrobiales bacterium]
MCGRFAITLPPEAVRAYFQYVEQPNFPPRTNIAPTQPVPVIRMERGPDGANARHFVLVRWGFLPGFVKDPKDFPLVINARSETAAEKPSFRNALRRRRCIIAADAFYEWQRDRDGKGKEKKPSIPFLIRRRDGAPMALAGLWETWIGPNGEEMDTACILTTGANSLIEPIHDRMPVILEPDDFDTWLSLDEETAEKASALMRPTPDDTLEAFEISTDINKVANDNPGLMEPVIGGLRYPAEGQANHSSVRQTANEAEKSRKPKRASAGKRRLPDLFD